jgi:hypothetical protein
MTPIEAYRAELRRQLAALPRLQRSTITRVVAELEQARRQVLAEIAVMTNAGARASRERSLAEIERQLQGWSAAASRIGGEAASVAWRQGLAMVAAPLAAAGLGRGLGAQVDARALASIQSVLTSRIAGASTEVIRQIDQVLLQVLIGTRPQSDAITRISELLGSTRRRAQTILFTELGRAHAMANHAAMLEAAEQIPGLRKRWLRSGKKHPRPSHFRAHNQIVLAAQPFVIENVRLMHPRDPAAPAKHTINCGCMSVPVVDGSTFGASNARFDTRNPESDVVMVRRDEATSAEIAMGVALSATDTAVAGVSAGASIMSLETLRQAVGPSRSIAFERSVERGITAGLDSDMAMALAYYFEHGRAINAALRDGLESTADLSPELMAAVLAGIDRGLSRLQPASGTVNRFLPYRSRGDERAILDTFTPGAVLDVPEYLSATVNERWMRDPRYVFRIELAEPTRGHLAAPLSDFPEGEVLFARGTRFTVLERRRRAGVWRIRLRELP